MSCICFGKSQGKNYGILKSFIRLYQRMRTHSYYGFSVHISLSISITTDGWWWLLRPKAFCIFDNKKFKVFCDRQLQYYLLQKCQNGMSKLKFKSHISSLRNIYFSCKSNPFDTYTSLTKQRQVISTNHIFPLYIIL